MSKAKYKITLKDKTVRYISVKEFYQQFKVAGHNFQERLKQFRKLFPTAVDWEMIEG